MKYLYHTLIVLTALVLLVLAVKKGDNYLLFLSAFGMSSYGLISGYYEDKITN